MARTNVGTIIGRKTASKGKEYARIWVYVPTKVSEDTAFPLKIGAPFSVEIGDDNEHLIIKLLSEKEAVEQRWRKRKTQSGRFKTNPLAEEKRRHECSGFTVTLGVALIVYKIFY